MASIKKSEVAVDRPIHSSVVWVIQLEAVINIQLVYVLKKHDLSRSPARIFHSGSIGIIGMLDSERFLHPSAHVCHIFGHESGVRQILEIRYSSSAS